jgi:hypothetical protein
MAFVYSKVASLKDKDKVGTNQCVALVQFYAAGVPHTSKWREGEAVLGNSRVQAGTAIATFVKGRYLSKPHGNHAAFFLRQGADGFWVMDQWRDKPGGNVRPISERFIKSLHRSQNTDGSWPQASDNADAFAVIEGR